MSLTTKFDQFIIEGLCSVQDSRMIDLIEIESCLFRDARQSFSKKYISEVEKEGLEKIQAYILDNYLKSHFIMFSPIPLAFGKGLIKIPTIGITITLNIKSSILLASII